MPATMPALAILQMMTIESESGNRGAILNLFQISFVDAGFPAANLGSFFSAAEKTSVQSEKNRQGKVWKVCLMICKAVLQIRSCVRCISMYAYKDRQTDRQTDRQIDRKKDR